MTDQDRKLIEQNVDVYGDSYCRDVTVEELRTVCFSVLLNYSNGTNIP
jgi:hypothetical protein